MENVEQKLSIETPMMNQHDLIEHAKKLEAMIVRMAKHVGLELKNDILAFEHHFYKNVEGVKPEETETPPSGDVVVPPSADVVPPAISREVGSGISGNSGTEASQGSSSAGQVEPQQSESVEPSIAVNGDQTTIGVNPSGASN